MKKVLITGATGLLGSHLISHASPEVEVFATVHEYKTVPNLPNIQYVDLDVTDRAMVKKVLQDIQPDIVIHTAAHGRVDYCENHPDEAKKTNLESTKYIVEELNKWDGTIFFCSTNMVFDGEQPPYQEENKTTGKTVYAQTKIASESYIQKHAKHFVIFRLMTMYGWNWQPERKNMISMSIEKLTAKQELWMTNDVFNNMLYVEETAKYFWKTVDNLASLDRQICHLAGAECLNRYQTVEELCAVFKFDPALLHEVSSDYFKGQEVPRSPNTCFNTAKAEKILSFRPLTIREGLTRMRKQKRRS